MACGIEIDSMRGLWAEPPVLTDIRCGRSKAPPCLGGKPIVTLMPAERPWKFASVVSPTAGPGGLVRKCLFERSREI